MEEIYKVNDKVYHIDYGWGTVVNIWKERVPYPLIVHYKGEELKAYSLDGRFAEGGNKVLSFVDYSKEKPFSQKRSKQTKKQV